MTEYVVKLADNGYVLSNETDNLLTVHEGHDLPNSLMKEILADLDHLIYEGGTCKFSVKVEINPIYDE